MAGNWIRYFDGLGWEHHDVGWKRENVEGEPHHAPASGVGHGKMPTYRNLLHVRSSTPRPWELAKSLLSFSSLKPEAVSPQNIPGVSQTLICGPVSQGHLHPCPSIFWAIFFFTSYLAIGAGTSNISMPVGRGRWAGLGSEGSSWVSSDSRQAAPGAGTENTDTLPANVKTDKPWGYPSLV